jgi:hypothetical protein
MKTTALLTAMCAVLAMTAQSAFAGLGDPISQRGCDGTAVEATRALVAKLAPVQALELHAGLSGPETSAGGDRLDEIIGQLILLFLLILAASLIIMAFAGVETIRHRHFC